MKLSIRFIILVTFTLLLTCVGTVITVIHYRAAQKILLKSTESIFQNSSILIERYINDSFDQAQRQMNFNSTLIKKNIIIPGHTSQFSSFLLNILIDLPYHSAASWSEPNGNYYAIERATNDTFYSYFTVCRKNLCTKTNKHIDINGRLLEKLPSTSINQKSALDINSSYPIYDKQGKLLGTFSLSTKITTLSKSISTLNITKNGLIFIFDDHRNLIAANDTLSNIPWLNAAPEAYKHTDKKLVTYKFNGDYYLAYYNQLSAIKGTNWFLGMAVPAKDITGDLDRQLMLSISITLLILLIAIFIVWLISKRISRPIINIANETKLIKELELQTDTQPQSHIKEIAYMQNALTAMKQSLRSFASYVPFTLVKKLMASGDIARVGGESKNVTFMFIDIQGFTSISEKMPPQELMTYLSEYFETLTKIILDNKGTVDKYMGDAIMAFWGAPSDDDEHAFHACETALKIVAAVKQLNKHWQQTGKPQITIRVGIGTGMAVIGNVGSQDRLSYTAIGDSVNLANRLEGLNKFYKTTIIVSSSTFSIVEKQFSFRLLDNVAVRGKNIGSYIYELIQKPCKYSDSFNEAFVSYQKGDWQQALKLFTKFSKAFPRNYLTQIYIERCKNFAKNPPKKWDGVWRFE